MRTWCSHIWVLFYEAVVGCADGSGGTAARYKVYRCDCCGAIWELK